MHKRENFEQDTNENRAPGRVIESLDASIEDIRNGRIRDARLVVEEKRKKLADYQASVNSNRPAKI